MADGVEIKVDATRALAKFDRIPVSVRDNLRKVLPDLTKQLGSLVDSKLSSGLKSRSSLTVKQELVENIHQIYGRVSVVSSKLSFLPKILESGARPHVIEGNPFLSFFWEKLGKQVVLRSVNHPGFPGIHYMQDSFSEMRDQIVSGLKSAVKEGAKKAQP